MEVFFGEGIFNASPSLSRMRYNGAHADLEPPEVHSTRALCAGRECMTSKKAEDIGVDVRPSLLQRFGKKVLWTFVGVCALGFGSASALIFVVSRDLPNVKSLEDYRPKVISRVFDKNGELVARFYKEKRTVVPVERIPDHVKNAFIAAEDKAFYSHGGINYIAVVKAVLTEVKYRLAGGRRMGGSTITQQTAKTFLLTNEQTFTRKLKDMLLAKQIESHFTKDEILYLYLNQIYFGHGVYGVEEAARLYYGVSVEKLSLGQAAVLASVPKHPNRINPFTDPKRVRGRKNYVLQQMEKNGMISDEERQKALLEPVRVHAEPPAYLGVAPYYAEEVRRHLCKRYGKFEKNERGVPECKSDVVDRGGLKVYTTMDAKLQKAATRAMQEGLRAVDKRQGYRGPLVRLDPDEAKSLLVLLDAERTKRFPPEETPELQDPLHIEGRPVWDLSRLRTKHLSLSPTLKKKLGTKSSKNVKKKISDSERLALAMRKVRTKPLQTGIIVGAVVKKVDNLAKKAVVDLGTLTGTLPLKSMIWAREYNPTKWTKAPKKVSQILKVGDVVMVQVDTLVSGKKDKKGKLLSPWVDVHLEQTPKVEGAFVAIDPHTHDVLALVGGYDYARSSFNRATQAKRQPGSAFKPFIYGLGIEKKQFTPVGFLDEHNQVSHLITDAQKNIFDRWTGKAWRPKNSGNKYRGDITLRTCLTYSVNTCSVSLLEKIGVEDVVMMTQKMGLLEGLKKTRQNLTLALGTAEVQPLALVNAYSIFPEGGQWAPPRLMSKVKTSTGEVLDLASRSCAEAKEKGGPLPAMCRTEPLQIIDEGSAYVMAEMMKSVVEDGTAKRAKALERPVAGKTGTTNNARTVWFVGYTPGLVAGSYVGFDSNAPLGHREYGGKAALPIWLSFMKEAMKDREIRDFERPDDVERVAIDRQTGLRAPPETITEAPAVPDDPGASTMDATADDDVNAVKNALALIESTHDEDERSVILSDPMAALERAENVADLAVLEATAGDDDEATELKLVLPEGAYWEVFRRGTAPMVTVEDRAPVPLELMDGAGGLTDL
ncbi:MAG: PBP1A family penicillin-binding protein [Deltaproteobacteria bacterium]|nr:PBP1A family penicillin-binding protein [Deltaproteobacteria bacterium]